MTEHDLNQYVLTAITDPSIPGNGEKPAVTAVCRRNGDAYDILQPDEIVALFLAYEEVKRQHNCAQRLLSQAWDPESVDYDLQGVNQAHRVLYGGMFPRGVKTTLEQEARELLSRIGIKNVQDFSAGDLVELANLIGMAKGIRK